MKTRLAILLLILAVVFGGIFGWNAVVAYMADRYLETYEPPPLRVEVQPVRAEQWHSTLNTVGSLNAVNGVDITTEVSGLIQEIYFASGQEVDEEQVLVQLEDGVEQATLKSFLAQLKLARINYERDRRLIESKAISKTDFDTSEAKLRDIEAQVERTRALIEQKRIRAPFSGRLGIRLINVGEFIDGGHKLVTLQSLDYLNVDFRIPERYFPRLYFGQEVLFRVKAYGTRQFRARVSAINAKVDTDTRNILVRASFANDDKSLVPGMFADLQVILAAERPVLTVPQTAISYSLYGDSVYVLRARDDESESGLVAQRRYVEVGARQGGRVAISKGVEEGERVVVSGQLKLSDGTRVKIGEAP